MTMWNACRHNVDGTLLVTLRRDGEQNTRTGSNPDEILAAQQRCDPQTGGLVLPDDFIAIRKHLVNGGGEIHFGNQLVAVG